ncbi:MAG: hypothetical protein HY223_03215 [Thaumarchaeota archaeon]|nr:hypothetical protein [Nitrososphaerota archaeon]
MLNSKDSLKALVSLVIEKTLLDIGKPVYEKVTDSLCKKYHCYIPDCFEKPEYLKAVLKDLYGESYDEIINSIKRELDEFVYNKKVNMFLRVLL